MLTASCICLSTVVCVVHLCMQRVHCEFTLLSGNREEIVILTPTICDNQEQKFRLFLCVLEVLVLQFSFVSFLEETVSVTMQAVTEVYILEHTSTGM